MTLDWKFGPLAEGVRCYQSQRFWLAHEHWESVWLLLQEPEKSFLQALIQIAAAFHHLQSGNTRGAASLLSRALARLESYPAEFCAVNLTQLRKEAGAWLLALESGAESRQGKFPKIWPVDQIG